MGDERVTPELFFRHYTSQRGISVADLGVQPLTVVTWMPSVARSLAEALGATAVADSYWGPEFAVGTAGAGRCRWPGFQSGPRPPPSSSRS